MAEKGSKKGSISGSGSSKLTRKEAEILSLIIDEDLTPKQLSCRLGVSHSYSCRIFRNLQKKGALGKVQKKVQLSGLGLEQKRGVRLHGERWKLRIIYKDEKYLRHLKEANSLVVDHNTVKLFEGVILVYSNQSFFGDDAEGATVKALVYWNRFFVRLENDLDVILVKARSQNIKRYRAEYALINNGLARKCRKEGEKIRLRDRGDGRIWFEIDNSLNLDEAETKHPVRAELDMKEAIEPFFNDLRDNGPYKISDFEKAIGGLIRNQEYHAENIRSHIGAIKEMSNQMSRFGDTLIKFEKLLEAKE